MAQFRSNLTQYQERGGGGYSPPIHMSTKMQNGKKTTFLALWRLFYALEWIK